MTSKLRKICFLLALPQMAFAGLSLVLTPGATATFADPVQPLQQTWRVEFQLHDWTIPSTDTLAGKVFALDGAGLYTALRQDQLWILSNRDGAQCILPLANRTNVLVRVQRDVANSKLSCEEWNSDGSGYAQVSGTMTHPAATTFSGGSFGSSLTRAQLGFLRMFDTLLPEGSRPPTTAGLGNLLNFTFDGTGQDTSGKSRNMSLGGTSFQTTPNQLPVALPKTDAAPSWSNWTSFRAGFPATLDGSASFSLTDDSDSVSYRWQQMAGPSAVRWSNRSIAKPVIRGLIFGTYRFRLQVTDASGKSVSSDLEVGAVATDDNGVVVQANPAADILFGPMIAFGKNPWPWMDQMALHSAEVRSPYLDTISPPGWGTDQPGTISYELARPGQPAETTIASEFGATTATLTVTNASKLDLTTFPVIIALYRPGSYVNIEELRICSASGNVLTVCYDGRNWRAGTYLRTPAPQLWAVGSVVRQFKMTGTGTNFLSVFCPAGAGEEGQIRTAAGTVQVTPGSNQVTGTGVAWSSTLNTLRIRIEGTHSGQPFVFFAAITGATANTLTISRPWPANADAAAGLTYAILVPGRTIARGWIRPDGTTGRQGADLSTCTSDTDLYTSNIVSEIPGTMVAQHWGFSDSNWVSDFGPNFYDEVLAHYAGYFRSGYNLFLDNARKIGDYWGTNPSFDEGWIPNYGRRTSGTGVVAGAVLDSRDRNWITIRKLASRAVSEIFVGAITPGCDADVRETAYSLSWLAMAALFDPVDTGDPAQPNQRSYWKAQLARALPRDLACKGPNNEYPISYWKDDATRNLTMTKGSTAVTGTNIPRSLCNFVSSGTINVTNGSTAATGTNFSKQAKISISGKRNGKPVLLMTEFSVQSPNSITMESPWDGDSGTYYYQAESDLWWLAFAKDFTDHENADIIYACRWVDSSNIVIDRPWHGETGTWAGARGNLIGYGQQPFLAGIKVFAMNLASLTDTGSVATSYGELARGTANWILSKGFDPDTGGLHYARVIAGCEPKLNPRLNCTFATYPAAKMESRTLNAEAQNAVRVVYQANPTPENKQFGDQFYGAQWGKLGGPYYDDIYLVPLESDKTWAFKWLGFMFGMGMAHQWPAVRLGGVRPPDFRAASVTFNPAGTPGAVSARIVVTQPSGAEATYACPSSPCSVSVDARQGAHWYRISYLNSTGAVLASQEPELLELR
jgi:hypothetical protein